MISPLLSKPAQSRARRPKIDQLKGTYRDFLFAKVIPKTIGGFALNLFGHLPKVGEQIVHGDLRLLVAEVKENQITRLFVTKERKAEEPDDAAADDSSAKEKGRHQQ